MKRRDFLKVLGMSAIASALPRCAKIKNNQVPNIILCMTDDQGWGDVGFHGHPVLKTPNLDKMAANGLRLDRFYAAAPVCSPTRGSCLTGRHPYRYGIYSANVGHMKSEEVTLAEVLKEQGYTTGFFGKWHLGTLTTKVKDSNRGGPEKADHYSPPWDNGFDVCFATEAKVPTWDPMIKPEGQKDRRWWNPVEPGGATEIYGTRYWKGPDNFETENLDKNDSRVIMDRAIPFIQDAVSQQKSFFTVIWFHAPHWPVVAGEKFRNFYKNEDEFTQNHFGCISAMDEQVGRLRDELVKLGVSENTMLWFCADNGPEGTIKSGPRHGKGSAGPYCGRKRDLYEGGIRVPGIVEWPAKIKHGGKTEVPACTSDYLPTILNVLRLHSFPHPLDGISLLPLIEGKMNKRPKPIAFESKKQLALIDNQYKLISTDNGKTFELFDILNDKEEKHNIANKHVDIVEEMKKELFKWRASCEKSRDGEDY